MPIIDRLQRTPNYPKPNPEKHRTEFKVIKPRRECPDSYEPEAMLIVYTDDGFDTDPSPEILADPKTIPLIGVNADMRWFTGFAHMEVNGHYSEAIGGMLPCLGEVYMVYEAPTDTCDTEEIYCISSWKRVSYIFGKLLDCTLRTKVLDACRNFVIQ